MLNAIVEFFSGISLVKAGFNIWNDLTGIAISLFATTPRGLAGGALWNIATTLLISMKLIGASLFSLMFFINFCKKSANLRDDRTIEMEVELIIKLILGDLVIVNIDTILSGMIEIMQLMLNVVAPQGMTSLALNTAMVEEWDGDSMLLGLIFGIIFLFVCLLGALMLILFVYSVFFKMFYYIVISPLALASIAGPEGAARTAESWFKTFICCLFEFVGMMLMMRLCAALINSNIFFGTAPTSWDTTEALWNIIQSILVILLTVGSVKSVDNLTRRAFGF